MNIAILGAGFCGLATAWHLTRQIPQSKITLFDPLEIGKGTSGLAAGMLHPYAGLHAKLNPRAAEGMLATKTLLNVAENALGYPIAIFSGLLRLAISPEQSADFSKCAQKHSDVRWFSADECQSKVPDILPYPGMFIDSGIIVDCESYLKGLWTACQAKGVQLIPQSIVMLAELDAYDVVVVTVGAAVKLIPELAHLPVGCIKGQILECSWPNEMPPLPFPINSQAYIMMKPDHKTCIVGATFERNFNDSGPDVEIAAADIMPKVQDFFPALKSTSIINCKAGMRASTPGHMPLLKEISPKCWVLTGMGSKGLLYHALYAQELAHHIAK